MLHEPDKEMVTVALLPACRHGDAHKEHSPESPSTASGHGVVAPSWSPLSSKSPVGAAAVAAQAQQAAFQHHAHAPKAAHHTTTDGPVSAQTAATTVQKSNAKESSKYSLRKSNSGQQQLSGQQHAVRSGASGSKAHAGPGSEQRPSAARAAKPGTAMAAAASVAHGLSSRGASVAVKSTSKLSSGKQATISKSHQEEHSSSTKRNKSLDQSSKRSSNSGSLSLRKTSGASSRASTDPGLLVAGTTAQVHYAPLISQQLPTAAGATGIVAQRPRQSSSSANASHAPTASQWPHQPHLPQPQQQHPRVVTHTISGFSSPAQVSPRVSLEEQSPSALVSPSANRSG